MTSKDLVSDRELEKRYVAGQPMKELTEEDAYALTYAVGHPIKNCALARTKPSFFGEFGSVAQSLWALRGHPEYTSYSDGGKIKVADVLGIDLEERGGEIERISEEYDVGRTVSVGLGHGDGTDLVQRGDGLVYLPQITGIAREGILTDIVKAYRGKALTIPFDPQWLDEVERLHGKDLRDFRQTEMAFETASRLLLAGLIVPHLYGDKMEDTDLFYWDPAKMEEERYMAEAERMGIKPLEDKIGYATQLIGDFSPDNLERFQRALK